MLIRATSQVLRIGLAGLCLSTAVRAQPAVDMQNVIERLDRMEKENRELLAEIQELRRQLKPATAEATAEAAAAETPATSATTGTTATTTETTPPTSSERLDVLESRTEELAQTKLGTSQRMSVSLTGMVLFNAFHNGVYGGSSQYPVTAQLNPAATSSAASFRQTVIGLKFNGPGLPWGGKASGSAYFDFLGGTATPGNNLFRLRLATIDLSWKNTTVTVGQDKPIVSPREPMSLAQVGVSPLTGAGNLWNWEPQMRIEHRFVLETEGQDATTGMTLQTGVYETAEVYPSTGPSAFSATLGQHRPAWEGRLLFFHITEQHGAEKRRVEIAPGFHISDSHVAGQTIAARLGTLDWLVKPSHLLAFSGALFLGTDDAGLGALRQGFTILASGTAIPVHATGGWGQLSLFPTPRLSLNIYGGEEADRASDLVATSVRRNLVYAGNAEYRLAPNVLVALETSQTRTTYIASGVRLNNHYDLALAYLF